MNNEVNGIGCDECEVTKHNVAIRLAEYAMKAAEIVTTKGERMDLIDRSEEQESGR